MKPIASQSSRTRSSWGFGGVAGLSSQTLPPGLVDLSGWQLLLAIVSGPAWYGLLFTVLVMVPLLFPSGSAPTRRWRWVGWMGTIAFAGMSALWIMQESFCTEWQGDTCINETANPIGITGLTNPEEVLSGGIFYGLLLVGTIAALISLAVRFRGARAVERQQIKWVAFSVGMFVTCTVIVDVVWVEALGNSAPPGYSLVQQALWLLIPASIAVVILRYHLCDIDRIVSRTVSYALIAIVLTAVYAGGVIGLQRLLPTSGDLAIAASTLAAAALFPPSAAE